MTNTQRHLIETLLNEYRTDRILSLMPERYDPVMIAFWNTATIPNDLTVSEASLVISAMKAHNPNNLHYMMETQPDWATGAILRRFAQ
jgi:hypothetical protein